jgi:hypothetical protein
MPEPRPGSDPNCALAYECLHLDVERPRHSIRLVFDAYITSSPVPKRVVEGIDDEFGVKKRKAFLGEVLEHLQISEQPPVSKEVFFKSNSMLRAVAFWGLTRRCARADGSP